MGKKIFIVEINVEVHTQHRFSSLSFVFNQLEGVAVYWGEGRGVTFLVKNLLVLTAGKKAE